jgi:hypothetical protein
MKISRDSFTTNENWRENRVQRSNRFINCQASSFERSQAMQGIASFTEPADDTAFAPQFAPNPSGARF